MKLRTCYDCIHKKSITPLPGDMICNLVCDIQKDIKRKWIINYPILHATFCKKYVDSYMLDHCLSYCENSGTSKCPTSILCFAQPDKPYFKKRSDYDKYEPRQTFSS